MPLTEYNYREENAIDRKLYGRSAFQKASALLFFEDGGLAQTLIHGLKYRGLEPVGGMLGKWMGSRLLNDRHLPEIDWVIPVPLHPAKLRKRGYNQCTRFGKTLAGILGAQWGEKFLFRNETGRSQTQRGRSSRSQGTLEAFRGHQLEDLQNQRILLVDDVVTTGATLEACCNALNSSEGVLPEIYIAVMGVVL